MKEDNQRKWEEVKHQGMIDRKPLPKVNKDKNVKHFIRFGNKVIADIKASSKEPLNIRTVNELVYATAVVITEAKGVKVKKGRRRLEGNLNGKRIWRKIFRTKEATCPS